MVPDPTQSTKPFKGRAIDLLDGAFYAEDPYPTYAWMRENAPAYWDSGNELWGISRYDDVVSIEQRKKLFINSDQDKGGYRPNLPADPAIIGLDDPHHSLRRKLVSRRFTPRAVSRFEDHVRDVVRSLIDTALAHGGPVEIVSELAAPLPAEMIGLLLGFPAEMTPKLQEWSERSIMLGGGPRYMNDEGVAAVMDFAAASAELYEHKQGCPADDVMSVWTTAEVPGHEFGLDQVISDCLLLLDGGAETTRTVIARTLLELAARPDQWALLRDGADLEVATEEFVRWVTPIHNMCRVATEDTEVGGETIRAGDQVVLMYPSANRDTAHFDDPEEFDVTRHPNHHLSFGFGTHFCLGASLARLEIRIFFEELRERVAELAAVPDSVVEMPNAFVYGLSSAEMTFTPS
ncbi:MAG: cytochrome P450 [Microthrixaceae bacterium]|nr:cytochrome P450 [Microthrixaceae bacterium]MCO5320198.1 cytochrome P450 [Microthrixaceae bacterium]